MDNNNFYSWKMESQHLPPQFISNVNINFTERCLTFQCYNVRENNGGKKVIDWAAHLPEDETLTLSQFNNGEIISEFFFEGLKLIVCGSNFHEYSQTYVTLQYEGMATTKPISKEELEDKIIRLILS